MSAHEEDGDLVCPVCGVTFDCHEVLSPECRGEVTVGAVFGEAADRADDLEAVRCSGSDSDPAPKARQA